MLNIQMVNINIYKKEWSRSYDSDTSTYSYNLIDFDEDGWSVELIDKNSTNPVTTRLCTSINNKPITSMSYMFNGSKTSSIDTSSFDMYNVKNIRVKSNNTIKKKYIGFRGLQIKRNLYQFTDI